MRFAILGAGAMGSFFGGRLALGGYDVCLIDVNEAQIAAVNADGLTVESDRGIEHATLPAGRAADFSGARDAVIVFTKGGHTEEAIASAVHLVGAGTRVLTAQNGLGNAETIARHVPVGNVTIGTTNYAADLTRPAHVTLHGTGHIRIWAANGAKDAAVDRMAQAMTRSGLDCAADPGVETGIWEKVAFNAAINSLSAVARLRVGEIGDVPAGRMLAQRIIEEVAAVAHARDIPVDAAGVVRTLYAAFAQHRDHVPSMLRDILADRPTEIESINGAVLALARESGVAAGTTETLLLLVRLVERSTRQ